MSGVSWGDWALYASLALPAMVWGLTVFNLLTWPRGRSGHHSNHRISVLIPARNEADHIRACLEAACESTHPVHEIIVYDDASTDGTSEILADLKASMPELKVVEGCELPPGWVGKPHACHRLAQAAEGDFLLFLDADVRLRPQALERITDLSDRIDADIVTAVPRQITGSFAERLVLPMLHVTYTSWFPLVLTYKSADPRFLAANGQLLGIRSEAYRAIGGFEAVRTEVVDDMALCRRAKLNGRRVVFADGDEMADCRMYTSFSQIWAGFSKNLYEGIGAHPLALGVVLAMYGAAFLAPYVLLALGLVWGGLWLTVGVLGVLTNVTFRGLLAVRYRHRWWSVVLHPVAVLVFMGIACNSAYWHVAGRVQWRGRSYGSRAERMRAVQSEVS